MSEDVITRQWLWIQDFSNGGSSNLCFFLNHMVRIFKNWLFLQLSCDSCHGLTMSLRYNWLRGRGTVVAIIPQWCRPLMLHTDFLHISGDKVSLKWLKYGNRSLAFLNVPFSQYKTSMGTMRRCKKSVDFRVCSCRRIYRANLVYFLLHMLMMLLSHPIR